MERRQKYWAGNLRLIGALAGIWLLVTFGTGYFANALASVTFFGWPLPFYIGAQGALIVYLAIIGCYARVMTRLDDEYEQCRDTDTR